MLLKSLLIIMSFLFSIKNLEKSHFKWLQDKCMVGIIFSKVYLMEKGIDRARSLNTCLSCYTRKKGSRKGNTVQKDRQILVNNKIHVPLLLTN